MKLSKETIKPHEDAISSVLYLYDHISEQLEKKHGETFVKNNQPLIGQLVQAVVMRMSKIENKSDTISSGY